jgi:hypothetical protein
MRRAWGHSVRSNARSVSILTSQLMFAVVYFHQMTYFNEHTRILHSCLLLHLTHNLRLGVATATTEGA